MLSNGIHAIEIHCKLIQTTNKNNVFPLWLIDSCLTYRGFIGLLVQKHIKYLSVNGEISNEIKTNWILKTALYSLVTYS
jgi:hypothetical protein